MLRAVIADDEDRICQLISLLADWEHLGVEVAGIASNGPDALEMITGRQADILITDIRMPGFSGLELIERAKSLRPELEVVIISGYAQFDYARTAIQYGVGEYLLKPIHKETLNATLAKMAARCLERERERGRKEDILRRQNDEHERHRHSLIKDLADGRYPSGPAAQAESVYGFAAIEDICQVFMVKMDYDRAAFPAVPLEIVKSRMMDVFRPVLNECCADAVLGFHETFMTGVMNYGAGMTEDLRGKLRDGLNQLIALKDLLGPILFTLALGRQVTSAASLAESYASALSALTDRLVEGTERLLEERKEYRGMVWDETLLSRFAGDMAKAAELLDMPEALRAVTALYDAAANMPGARGRDYLSLTREAGAIGLGLIGSAERERELSRYRGRLDDASSVRGLFDCLNAFIAEGLRVKTERVRNRDAQPIRLAKQYIHKHFSDPVTLEEVSDAIGFSASYFSALFKKETGEGFSKYLTRVRMEEAKALLRDTRHPVSQICVSVGYADIKHFKHSFKSVTGLTPGEFRKLYG